MRHAIILVDFLCLLAGLTCLARLASLYRAGPTERSRTRLVFFGAYSYVMVAAALFAYAAVNIGVADEGHAVFASLIFVGMAALELSMPPMIFAERGAPLPKVARRLIRAGAALTAAQAALIWAPLGRAGQLLGFLAAFAPFGAVIAWAIIAGARPALPKREGPGRVALSGWLFGGAYALILLGSVFEIRSAFASADLRSYLPLSLPLAYLTSSLQFFASSARKAGGRGLTLPPELARRQGLSPREVQIADSILEGLGNKEIAAKLGISENTVRNHIYSLYQKLGIQKRMDLLGLVRGEADSTKIPGSPGAD
jgi:DNA-binding CsgD family transcriptional regulator